jgi:hypothetical protein
MDSHVPYCFHHDYRIECDERAYNRTASDEASESDDVVYDLGFSCERRGRQ